MSITRVRWDRITRHQSDATVALDPVGISPTGATLAAAVNLNNAAKSTRNGRWLGILATVPVGGTATFEVFHGFLHADGITWALDTGLGGAGTGVVTPRIAPLAPELLIVECPGDVVFIKPTNAAADTLTIDLMAGTEQA